MCCIKTLTKYSWMSISDWKFQSDVAVLPNNIIQCQDIKFFPYLTSQSFHIWPRLNKKKNKVFNIIFFYVLLNLWNKMLKLITIFLLSEFLLNCKGWTENHCLAWSFYDNLNVWINNFWDFQFDRAILLEYGFQICPVKTAGH